MEHVRYRTLRIDKWITSKLVRFPRNRLQGYFKLNEVPRQTTYQDIPFETLPNFFL